MKLEPIINVLQPVSIAAARGSMEIAGVACDSRQVGPGFIFVAVPGTQLDGWSFVEDALSRGAAVIVAEREGRVPRDICLIHVTDARHALAQVASTYYGQPSGRLTLFGVTGTNGKTTTTYMIRNILTAAGREPGLIGTVETTLGVRAIPARRTTPDAVALQSTFAQMLGAGCDSVVMEVSSHALHQKRTDETDFDVAVFTNLTRDHLDYHLTMEAYAEAKLLLFRQLGTGKKKGIAVVNVDDPFGRRIAALGDLKAPVLTFGVSPDAQIRARDVQLHATGSRFTVETPWGRCEVCSDLLGDYNVSNALAALAAGGAVGIDLELMARVFAEMPVVPGRLERVENSRGIHVFVDYAHTDDALENVLRTVRPLAEKKLLLVFGCGGNRDRTKRPLMGRIASRMADHTIITSDNPRREDPEQIVREIHAGFEGAATCEIILDRADAIQRAMALATPGDLVLIAGKGHEKNQEFSDRTVPFDDVRMARRFL